MNNERCADCKNPFPVLAPDHVGGTGRVEVRGEEICYPCACEREKDEMEVSDAHTAYLSRDAKSVTTWSGHTLGTVTQCKSIKCFGQIRLNLTIRAFDGSMWTARAASEGLVCTLRRKVAK